MAPTFPMGPLQILTLATSLIAQAWAFTLLVTLTFTVKMLDDYSNPPPHSMLFRFGKRCILSIQVRQPTFQKQLRIAAMAFYSIGNLLRVLIYCIETTTQKAIYDGEEKHCYILSILFNIAFWLAYYSYILAVSDRFQRIEMIVPNTPRHTLYKASQWIIGIVLGLVLLLRTICQIGWIFTVHYYMCPSEMNLFNDLYLVVTALFFVVIELGFNIRLIVSSLKVMISMPIRPVALIHDDQQDAAISLSPAISTIGSPDVKQDIQPSETPVCIIMALDKISAKRDSVASMYERRQRRKLFRFTLIQHEMIFYFVLLVILDLAIIGMHVIASGVRTMSKTPEWTVPVNELEAWGSTLVSLHLYFGFKLLDLFLFKLQDAKRRILVDTTVVDERHPLDGKGLTSESVSCSLTDVSTSAGAEVVTSGLLSSVSTTSMLTTDFWKTEDTKLHAIV